MPNLTDQQLHHFRELLQQRASALRGEIRAVDDARSAEATVARDTVEDAADRADDLQRDEVRQGEEERDNLELRDVVAALQRIADGQYGECIECGRDIPLARLEVAPMALRCTECQQHLESMADRPAARAG